MVHIGATVGKRKVGIVLGARDVLSPAEPGQRRYNGILPNKMSE